MYQPPRREPEIDLEQIMQKVRAFTSRFGGGLGGGPIAYAVWGILLVAFVIWLATGIFQVSPGEQGVKRTFGKFSSIVDEGLHFHWPNPIGTTRVVSVDLTRSMSLGFRFEGGGGVGTGALIQDEARMITGDLNVVDAQLVVQYRIADLQDFIFNVADPGDPSRTSEIEAGTPEGRTLKDATEAALRKVVGQKAVDAVRTEQRAQVAAETQDELQKILDDYGAGMQILNVRLQDVIPPDEVRDAFDDVLRARQERDTAINLAEAFRRDQIPRAEGQAARITQAAEGFKAQQINSATGRADAFSAVLAEYLQSKDVTRRRLYLEAIETILPNINKIVVSAESEGNIILNAGSGGNIVPVPLSAPTSISPTPIPAP